MVDEPRENEMMHERIRKRVGKRTEDSSTALSLGAVLGSRLLSICNALRVEHAPNYVIANAGQIADTAAAYEHDGVLLEVMTFPRNVGGHLHSIG
jgi:hypothetical protein